MNVADPARMSCDVEEEEYVPVDMAKLAEMNQELHVDTGDSLRLTLT